MAYDVIRTGISLVNKFPIFFDKYEKYFYLYEDKNFKLVNLSDYDVILNIDGNVHDDGTAFVFIMDDIEVSCKFNVIETPLCKDIPLYVKYFLFKLEKVNKYVLLEYSTQIVENTATCYFKYEDSRKYFLDNLRFSLEINEDNWCDFDFENCRSDYEHIFFSYNKFDTIEEFRANIAPEFFKYKLSYSESEKYVLFNISTIVTNHPEIDDMNHYDIWVGFKNEEGIVTNYLPMFYTASWI